MREREWRVWRDERACVYFAWNAGSFVNGESGVCDEALRCGKIVVLGTTPSSTSLRDSSAIAREY